MEFKPLIGITLGDYNGIGPEVILKALSNKKILQLCTPVIYGSPGIFTQYRQLLGLEDWLISPITSTDEASEKRTYLITCWDEEPEIEPKKITPEAGNAAFQSLRRAVQDLKDGKLHGIVTAPINKHNIQQADFQFPGHTEFLTDAFGAKDSLMLMANDWLRIGVATGHIPLQSVSQALTHEKLHNKLDIFFQSLIQDFGIAKPRIAVLGLNPHAGEEGLLGKEETAVIQPVMRQQKEKGRLLFGPYPADGFFGTSMQRKFDGVLAMYHDQGLIPFKQLAFETGVNITAGLPIVRTSPDHGTAYDIAGQNKADATSMLSAILMAYDLIKARRSLI
jgi:4-hydroxythreonine-4-phosphate dehydrogenase